jgi:hypothetical protein
MLKRLGALGKSVWRRQQQAIRPKQSTVPTISSMLSREDVVTFLRTVQELGI